MKPISLTQQQAKSPAESAMCVENTQPGNLREVDKDLKYLTRDFPLKDREIEVRIDEDDDDTNR